jgi:nucleoside-diphosphate-sugar epimerase
MKDEHCTRVVVTGDAAFIGSHLCESLLERGHEVLCVDNFVVHGEYAVITNRWCSRVAYCFGLASENEH